jgi:putative tryptophan/tyrosine transport system substrate-binding protein
MIWLMSSDRPDAVPLTSDPAHQALMPEVIGFLLKSLFQAREHVVGGGLIPYGVSLSDLFRMGALCTKKFLRGTKPADLPIAKPVTFEFALNLGLEIPAMVIAQADKVIE